VAALQTHQTLIGIEVGDRAPQQQGFCPRRMVPLTAIHSPVAKLNDAGFENICSQIANLKEAAAASVFERGGSGSFGSFKPGCSAVDRLFFFCTTMVFRSPATTPQLVTGQALPYPRPRLPRRQ